jgi:hypothetical protein
MRNERGRLKAERDYNAKNELQRCVVCGRLFVRRKDNVCSIAAEKLDADAKRARCT